VNAVRVLALLLGACFVAGCGSGPPSTESVVRAWSQALNQDDNDTAANLFAPNAKVVQGGTVLRLKTHKDAVAWNSALPCSGLITSIHSRGQVVTATFRLGDRAESQCDGPGKRVTAIFKVVDGKIVLWHQTAREDQAGPSVLVGVEALARLPAELAVGD
jgi:limonene-1,2-epoxide hydrolase